MACELKKFSSSNLGNYLDTGISSMEGRELNNVPEPIFYPLVSVLWEKSYWFREREKQNKKRQQRNKQTNKKKIDVVADLK